jgi:glycosyltransferase involved in cell wall biosynthesis
VKILVLASNYPDRFYPQSGVFNEACVINLQEQGHEVEVFTPRPIAPPILSEWVARWKRYKSLPNFEVRRGVHVHRPSYFQIPYVANALSVDWLAYLGTAQSASTRHKAVGFDGILAFDLVGTAVMSWRLGRHLGLPTVGWITGHAPQSPVSRKVISRALSQLDAVFYQSRETLKEGAELLRLPMTEMAERGHRVLPRGIPSPPSLPRTDLRRHYRREWGIADDEIVIMSIGRISLAKGVLELLEALSRAIRTNSKIKGALIGSVPSLDDSHVVLKRLAEEPRLGARVKLLPACNRDRVWEYLCAADIFAFTSPQEGMPNSLLEAMAMKVPVVAFDIPPVTEAEGQTGGIVLVKAGNVERLADALGQLAVDHERREEVSNRGVQVVKERFDMVSNMAIAVQCLSQLAEKGSSGAAA